MCILLLIRKIPPIGGGGGKAADEIAGVLAQPNQGVQELTAKLQTLPRSEAPSRLPNERHSRDCRQIRGASRTGVADSGPGMLARRQRPTTKVQGRHAQFSCFTYHFRHTKQVLSKLEPPAHQRSGGSLRTRATRREVSQGCAL